MSVLWIAGYQTRCSCAFHFVLWDGSVLEAVLSCLLCNCFCAAYFDYKDESGFPKPPSYNVATTLPSYDEAERTKAEATIPLVPGRVSVLACLAVPALLGTIAALTPAHHVP